MNLERNIFKENASMLVAFQFEGITVNDVVNVFNHIIDSNVPSGKTSDDFTGGYIQQLSNSNQLVLYFGSKINDKGEKTNNRDTVKLDIEDVELDMFYAGLKAKILDMKIRKRKGTKKTVSMMDLFGDSNRETENVCDAEIIPDSELIENKTSTNQQHTLVATAVGYEEELCECCGVPYNNCFNH